MQSSKYAAAAAVRDAYETEHERDAFAAGYNHAHGIACHNVPKRGESYSIDSLGRVAVETVEDAKEVHAALCYEAEHNARCYSPWEFIAADINALDEGDAEAAWEAYEAGVSAAIQHDLDGYDAESYGFDDEAAA